MDDDKSAKLLCFRPKRRQRWIGEFASADIGKNLGAFETELTRGPLKLGGSFRSILERDGPNADKTIRCAGYVFRHSVVDHASGLDTDFDGDRVVALRWGRHHYLPIDPHRVEVAQPFRQAIVLAA